MKPRREVTAPYDGAMTSADDRRISAEGFLLRNESEILLHWAIERCDSSNLAFLLMFFSLLKTRNVRVRSPADSITNCRSHSHLFH
jgi:hypothetical protein